MKKATIAATLFATTMMMAGVAGAQSQQRGRDLGIPFEGTPGALNAITDVSGVEVGQVTLIEGEGKRIKGKGPIRTGVTVVLPRGKGDKSPVYAGFYNLNGNGEMTGQSYIKDFGVAYGPIGLSNTNAIGELYSGIQQWTSKNFEEASWPVVAETYDGGLNDIEGFHVKTDTVMQALDAAKGGAVEEGAVGGGTGMRCFGFKGGIGTSSRTFEVGKDKAMTKYTVGVLTQCNTGDRKVLRIAGAPVGQELADKWLPCYDPKIGGQDSKPLCSEGGKLTPDNGSIIIVVGTDAPLTPIQLDRVARRASLGLGRLGSYAGNSSGDLIVSFSTGKNVQDVDTDTSEPVVQFPTGEMDAVFNATAQATEEAVVNALVGAKTMTGGNGYTLYGLPHDELKEILKKYGRLNN